MMSINIKHTFIVLFLTLLVTLNLIIGKFLINWSSLVSIVQFIILQFINIGVAYGMTELILCLLVRADDLPKLEAMNQPHRVALLYLTCDDAVPQAILRLGEQTYQRYDVFILDDSSSEDFKKLVDTSGFSVIRRSSRKGFKAGNLNNWLTRYGNLYRYFVVADSDSMFTPDFIEQMVRYAEHPANANVAIFQSKIKAWNSDNGFVRNIAAWFPLWLYPVGKLANRCETMLSVGHNCLYRTGLIRQVGGFHEKFVAEDYATSLKLLEKGYRCRLVDVVSYEAVPTSLHSYTRRTIRWAEQTIQLLQLQTSNIPLTTHLHILMNAYSFLIWILYFPGMMLAVWGTKSNLQDLTNTVGLILGGQFVHTPLLQPLAVMAFFNFYFLFLRLPVALKVGISAKDYCKSLLMFIAMMPYIMIPLIVSQFELLVTHDEVVFNVTDKGQHKRSFLQFLGEIKAEMILLLVVMLGIAQNPVTLLYNASWLIPFMASPVIIYLTQRTAKAASYRPTSTNRTGYNLSHRIQR